MGQLIVEDLGGMRVMVVRCPVTSVVIDRTTQHKPTFMSYLLETCTGIGTLDKGGWPLFLAGLLEGGSRLPS